MMTFAAVLLLFASDAQAQKNPSFLQGMTSEHMTCGKRGFTFPGLVGGSRPVSACILKYTTRRTSGFGSLDF